MNMAENSKFKELVTTGLKIDDIQFNECLFLGDWCFRDNLSQNQPLILEYPIKSEDLSNITKEIDDVFKILLSKITKCYNQYFNLNKSEKYYNIILGRWLFHFLNNVYEKRALVLNAIENHPGIATRITKSRIVESYDSEDYNQNSYYSHEFNFIFFSEIIKSIESSDIKKIEYEDIINFNKSTNPINHSKIKNKLVSIYQNCLLKLNNIFCKELILVVSPYYPRNTFSNSVWFFFNSYAKIVHYKFNPIAPDDIQIDFQLRNLLKQELKCENENKLLQLSSNLLSDFIPKSLLESFINLKSEATQWHSNFKNEKLYFSAIGIHTNERFKYLVAEFEDEPLWITQHGFGYGSNKHISAENYETCLAKRHFTWGWGNYILPNPKLSIAKNLNYNRNTKILFTFPSVTYYTGLLETNLSYTIDFKNLAILSDKLIDNISHNIKKNIVIRQQKQKGLRILKLVSNVGEDHIIKFQDSLNESRIHLTNHFGTPFLESISFNIPTIVIHTPIDFYFRESAKEDFKLLMDANILFIDPIKAANHINNIYNNIDNWWYSDHTQRIVKNFTNKYAFSNKNWKNIWLNTLLNK